MKALAALPLLFLLACSPPEDEAYNPWAEADAAAEAKARELEKRHRAFRRCYQRTIKELSFIGLHGGLGQRERNYAWLNCVHYLPGVIERRGGKGQS